MDNVALPGVDIVHDLLDFPYPFEDGDADEIYLRHVIEHFGLSDIERILCEAHRILRPGGMLFVRVPHVFSVAAWADPTHKSAFTFGSGQFFDANSPKAYYKELSSPWQLVHTAARVTWFNWKRYRLRPVDNWASGVLAKLLDLLLHLENWPGGADLFVKCLPMFFVEIQWDFSKPKDRL